MTDRGNLSWTEQQVYTIALSLSLSLSLQPRNTPSALHLPPLPPTPPPKKTRPCRCQYSPFSPVSGLEVLPLFQHPPSLPSPPPLPPSHPPVRDHTLTPSLSLSPSSLTQRRLCQGSSFRTRRLQHEEFSGRFGFITVCADPCIRGRKSARWVLVFVFFSFSFFLFHPPLPSPLTLIPRFLRLRLISLRL